MISPRRSTSGDGVTVSEEPPSPELSLVIPAYNEAQRLSETLDGICTHLEAAGRTFELIVVDDGSSDDTSATASRVLDARGAGQVVTLPKNCGKGAATRAGVLVARGRTVLFSDADFSAPIPEEEKLRKALEGGADVAIGTRADPASDITQRQSVLRETMGRIFNLLVRLLGLSRFHDTQCGFKMFTREAALAIFPVARVQGFAFDVEILYLAERAGFRVVEVPVEWKNDPTSRVRMFRDSTRMILETLRIRWLYPPWRQETGVPRRPTSPE
jgi:dolichyl-phosphate beta-glucosyltransferase